MPGIQLNSKLMNYNLLIKVLQREFDKAQAKNPRMSRNSFAMKIGISPGPLSEILNGKRKISERMAKKILQKVTVSHEESDLIFEVEKKELSTPKKYIRLNAEDFEKICSWQYYGLLSALKLPNIDRTLNGLSQKLGLPSEQVKTMLDQLVALKMIYLQNDQYRRHIEDFQTTDNVASQTIQNSLLGVLDKAKQQLAITPVENRDYTTLSLTFDPQKMETVRILIRQLQDQVCSVGENQNATEVYQLAIQFFPLTK